MSLYTSVCRPLEMAKSYLTNPEAVDFCSNNVMNFSGKFTYCSKYFYPCPKSMKIYGEMDRSVFINTLHIDERFTSTQGTDLMIRLPRLKNVYLHHKDTGCHGLVPGGCTDIGSYKLASLRILNLKNLYEMNLDKLEIDYTGLINGFHNLIHMFNYNFDRNTIRSFLPDKIMVKNISITYRSFRYNEHIRNMIVRLLQNMGDQVRTLSIIKKDLCDPFRRIILGRNIRKLSLVEEKRCAVTKINLLGFGNKLEYLSIYPYNLDNPNNIIFEKLNHLSIAFNDVNFEMQIKKYSRWFPNITHLELTRHQEEYDECFFEQSHLDIIESSFAQCVTLILASLQYDPKKKLTFNNNVIFKLDQSYRELNIKKHIFLGNVSIIYDIWMPEKYDSYDIKSIVKRNDQKITIHNLDILAEAPINDKVSCIYVCEQNCENSMNIFYKFHEKTTVFHPILYTKNIHGLILEEARNFFKNISFCNFKKLEITFRKKNSLNLEITNSAFPNLIQITATGISLILCKNMHCCDIKKCDINLKNDVNIKTCSIISCNISGNGKIASDSVYICSNKIIDCLSLTLNKDACLLKIVGNYGKSIDFSSPCQMWKLKDILIKGNKSELTGEISISNDSYYTNHYSDYYIDIARKKIKINFNSIKATIGASEFVLIGDNIHCKSMNLHYFQDTTNSILFSRGIFIRSRNVNGTLYFLTPNPNVTYIHSDENPIGIKYIHDKNPKYYSIRENEQINPSLLKITVAKPHESAFITQYRDILILRPGFKRDSRSYPPTLFTISN